MLRLSPVVFIEKIEVLVVVTVVLLLGAFVSDCSGTALLLVVLFMSDALPNSGVCPVVLLAAWMLVF